MGVGSGRGSWGLIPARLPRRRLGFILGKGILASLPESHVGARLSPVHGHTSRWDLRLLVPDRRNHTLYDMELPKSLGRRGLWVGSWMEAGHRKDLATVGSLEFSVPSGRRGGRVETKFIADPAHDLS